MGSKTRWNIGCISRNMCSDTWWSLALTFPKNIIYKTISHLSHTFFVQPLSFGIAQGFFKMKIKGSRWHWIRSDVTSQPWNTDLYRPCHLSLSFLHMARQLCRSLLLGILLCSGFLHKWKQRALWFFLVGPSVGKQGRWRGTREFNHRAHRRVTVSCRDVVVVVSSLSADYKSCDS